MNTSRLRPGGIAGRISTSITPGRLMNLRRPQKTPEFSATAFEYLAVRVGGAERFLLREQEVAGETVAHLHFIANGAEILDAFEQDDLHVTSLPY